MELPVKEVCYRALQSRDARFDGLIYVGVKSTGIYCRPVCPARTAKYENCLFFGSAAAAQEAGFRPCLRCRPETAPNLASWRGTSNTVTRALALIHEGALDGDGAGVEALGDRLGIGERQLRRLFRQHLGASPIAVAQTRRVLFAKQLIHETQMPMTEVALAAGFGSLRRFNEVFQELFDRPPSALRRKGAGGSTNADAGVALRLRYRPPYDWPSMLGYLEARAIPGVEAVEDGTYRRTVEIKGSTGTVEVSHLAQRDSLHVSIRFPNVQCLPEIVARVRRLFDLGADIDTIDAHLGLDPLLAPLVRARPGLRAPGGWDGFELAVRAVLGQQISVVAARRLAGQLVALHGGSVANGEDLALTHVFPTAERLASVGSIGLGMPAARLSTLQALAKTAAADPNLFRSSGSIEDAIRRLRNVRGIGEWTAQYIAMRALREVDAFPATDVGLLRSYAKLVDGESEPSKLAVRAEAWRPWRAYAAQHLWAADSITAPIEGDIPMSEKQQLFIDRIDTAIGEMILVADQDGNLRAIDWADHEARMQRLLKRHYGENGFILEPEKNPSGLSDTLSRYFAGDVTAIDNVRVATAGTAFQREVWRALRDIPVGTTWSYAELARKIGRPKAVRAVGLANGSNPIGIVVPCHRVIGANGSLTGYGGGMERKRWLLDHERGRGKQG